MYLSADLFQSALRGAQLSISRLPHVGGSDSRSILRTGEPLRIDLDGWGRQRVHVGTTPIAQNLDRVDTLVLAGWWHEARPPRLGAWRACDSAEDLAVVVRSAAADATGTACS